MSKIKELFNERRVPTPGFILNLFTNDECVIDDEDKFFENVQRNIAGITIIERSASEYDAWKYMLFRMFELLERRLKDLSDLKANNYADTNELKKVERSIEVIIHFFDEFLRKIDELEEFSFPYFDQILDLTSNHQIVKSLTILGLTILFHQTYNQNNLIYLTSLHMFLDPFIRMLHHFEWDYDLMIKSLRQIFAEKSSTEKFPNTLKDLLKAILDNGSTIVQIVEEKALLESLETEPRTKFISNLHSEICKHNGIIKLENEQKYYKALGETALAAFLLAPELNEKLLPDITTMHCFKGTYFEPLRTNDDIPAKIMGLSFEAYDFQFKFILKPSIVDVAVSKCRDLTDLNNHRPEIQTEKLDEVIAFLVGIKRNIELFKASTILQDPGDDIIVFLKKLCCLDPQVDTSSQDPPLIEIWKIVDKLYKQHYSKVEDESYNTFGKLTESVKDKVNVLMYNTVSLIGSSMSEITEGIEEESGESQETFREEFYLTANYLIEELVKKFEEFSLEDNYTSIIVMFAMCSTFKEISYIQVSGSLHIPVRMIKKLESMLKLSYTPEFTAYFESTPQPEFAFKVLLYLLEMIGTVFASYDGSGTLATSAKNEYIAYMSNFNIIDIIAGNNNQSARPANEHARRSQEELIRYYIALHLESQLLVFSNTQTEQTIFYDFEKLKLIWRLIMDYSNYENYIEDEFNMTLDIIDNLEGEDSMMKQAQILDAEVMSALFDKCFLNLDVAVDLKEFEPIKDILVALSERDGWDIFTTQLSITLQQKFEALVDAQEILESLYVQQDPLFTKNFMANEYRISEFFKRIRPLLKLMRTYDFAAFSNDMSLKSVLSEYLPRLMISPSFYLIGYTGGTELVSMMSRLTIISSILEKVLPDYALRAFETIVTINQGLQEPDPNSLIRRMLDSEKGRHYSMDKFFVANFLDNPFEIHTLGSKLFYAVYLNSLGLKNLLDVPALQPPINDFLMLYNFRLPDIIEALVKMEHLRLKIRLKQGINPSVATFLPVNDEDFNSWSPISSARDYFQNKSTLLMDMFTKSEKQNTGSDDNFLYKCSIFLLMQDMVSVLPPEDLLNLYSIDGSIEKMFEFTFICLQKIIAIISTNTSKISEFQLTGLKIIMQDEGEITISEQNLKSFYEYLCRIIGDEFDNFGKQANQSFISFYRHDKQKADLIKGQVSNYLRRIGESMAYSLPKIDQNLLKLSVLDNTDNPIISPLSRMMKNMFLLYAKILTKVAEIYGTKEEETKVTKKKQMFKPKLDKKGKGAKGHRGAKGARRRSSQLLDHQAQVAQKEEEAKAEDSDEEVEEFEEDDDGDGNQILEQGKQVFKEMMSRFFIFYNLEFDTPTIMPAYRKVFNSFLENCLSCLETMKGDPNFSSGSVNFLNSRVYQNPVINKLRVLSPLLLFMTCLMTENQIPDESDHEFYVKVITKIIEEITTLIPQLNIDDISKEDIKFIENDFTRAYRGIIYSLSVMSEQLLVFYLDYGRMLDTFHKNFELLYLTLTKWADICSVYKSARTHSPNLFSRKNLLVVFLFGIHNDETYQKFAKDKKILDLLITYCGKYFYLIAELYALQAYEPEKILTIKLKSLVYLDKTGSRIFQNYSIKTLEKYWQEELKATWNEKFSIQKQTDKENKHSNKIVTPKETIDMKGKVNLPIEGNTVSVSTLTFLIEGIDVNAKNIMQAILRNIVVNTQDQIFEIIKNPAVKQDANILRMALHSQIGCLAVLLKNYPELSAIVASYKTESKVDAANVEYTDFLPQQKDNESFLGFYVRNVCYFYHFTVSYMLEAMVEQNETAIFVQCEGEPILLSVFNELVIFEEIFKTLEATFKEPEKFLKTLYTSATWTSLSQISINLLKLRSEVKQKDYRLEIIQRLYSICLEALKVYRNANKKQEIHLMEESKVINVFMVELVDLETSIRAKAQLIKSPKPVDQSVYSKGKLKWVCSLLKEHSYLELSSQIDQNTIQPLPVNLRAHLEEESKLIEKYSPGSERIHANVILGLFNEAKGLFYKGHPNLPEINLFNFSSDQTKELELTLKRFGPQSNYAHHLKGDYQKQIADRVYHYLQDYSDNLSQAYLNRFGLEGSCLITKAKLFLPPLDGDRIHRSQPQPTFRVLVKKSVGWHYEKKEENIVIEAAAQLIEDKKEENFGALIKKMGLDKLKDLIRKNKRRIKLMIQQQHEKYLMAKLEAMLKREVNITEMMSLDVDVDNQAFFNEKNDLDKKLIMLLANKDFLDSLTKEIQDQSKSLKKAFIDEDKKNGGDEDNSEDDVGSDDDDDNDDGNNNRRINRRRREELRRQANSEDEDDDDDDEEEDDDSDLSEDDGDDDKDSEELKEDKEKANAVNKDKIEAVDNKNVENKGQVEVENGINLPEEKKEEKPEQKDIAVPEVIPSSQPEEINNKKEDKEEEEKRDESKGEENVVYYATGSESNFEGDSDYYEDDENSLGSAGEKGEVWEEQKGEPEVVRSHRSINQETKIEEKKEIDTNKDVNDEHLEDNISSNCHTPDVSEVFYEPESVDENENDDYYSEGEEEEHDEGSVNYDYLHEVNDENDDVSELTEFKGFMVQTKKVEKALTEAKFLPRPPELFLMNPGTEVSLQDLPEQILFLFSFNKKLDVLDSTGQLSKMDSYSLFYKFLITVLLDPYKEATVLPLLALYLLGYNLKASKNIPSKSMVKDKIINFLHQYAIRSPSIFFKSFNISSFDAYLEHSEIEGEPLKDFTLLDLLFKFYFISCSTKTKKTDTTGIYILLQRLLHLLLQIRFICKDEELPVYLKELRSKGQPPLKEDIMEEVFKVSEKFSKVPNSIDITQFCKWLEYLARLPQYRKGILLACDRMLSSQISEEKTLLENFIKEAKQSLNSSNEPTSADKYIYNNFSSKLNPQTPLILNIFSYILNELESDSEIKSFVQEAETFKFALKDIALLYMEVLELISKLKDKNYIEFRTGLKLKLKKMIEVPVQYHLYLSKLKDAGLGSPSKNSGLDLTTPPSLVKISSDTDSLVPPGLERSYSSARNESVNFQEILTQWMKKHRNFINTTFKVSSVGKENLDLWIVKKFPWVLDFNVKEKILRDAFAERNKGEDEMDDDDEITLFIRRKHILHDTLQEFERHSQETTIYNFKIEFVNEPGVDQGGLKKEWLNLLSKEIFDPMVGLFKLSPNLRSIHPNPISRIQPGVSTYFKLAGILVGLAIKEKIPIDVNFSKSFLKLLLDTQPNLNDLEDLDPDFMQSLTWMLQNDVNVLEQPFIYELEIFGLKTVQELKENGSNIIVDESNKELYVSKILQSKTLKEVEPQIHSFKTGLFEIVPEDLARLFSSGEMEILISGKSQIDIKDLMQHVNYRELNKDSLLVKWFWEIVEFMDQNMLANLLFFITGSSKVPHGGFKDSPIVLARGPSDTSSLPIAHTCFSELEIPLYESKEQFSEKLFLAISEGKEGFYIA